MQQLTVDPGGFRMNVGILERAVPMDTLFIHGNLASNTWWRPAVDIWEKQPEPGSQGRLILAEWRGCGESAAPETADELRPERLADDYVALLEILNVDKACLVGHSTGGLIGLCAIGKAPERFARAVLLDPVGATGVKFPKEAYDSFTRMSRDRDYCAAVIGATIHGHDPQRPHPLFERIVDDAFGVAELVWHGIPDGLSNVDITEQLDRIRQPILVLHGEHDWVLPKEDSAALAAKLPNGRFEEIKGQGHSTNVEAPGLFVRLVNDFLFGRDQTL